MSFAGMIAFAESGDYEKMNRLFIKELPGYANDNNMTDVCEEYEHNFVYETLHSRNNNSNIRLTHILMDFTDEA